MASKSQELRRLMKQQKQASKKVNHPLAKYNNLDQISRKHKENVVALKSKSSDTVKSQAGKVKPKSILKKESVYDEEPPNKKSKGALPDNFFDNPQESNNTIKETNKQNISPETKKEVLPKDFFDNSSQQDAKTKKEMKDDPEEESNSSSNRKSSASAENLPEGFFDDPKKDAKARNVEYVDPQDLEWEKFQKMIQEETKVADEIRDEEDEEAEMMKDMTEYNNMKSCLSRVEALKSLVKNKQERNFQSHHLKNNDQSSKDDDGEDTDEDIDGLFDWRAKMA